MKHLLLLLGAVLLLSSFLPVPDKNKMIVGTWVMEGRTIRFYTEKEKKLVKTRYQTPDSFEKCRRDDAYVYLANGTGKEDAGERCALDVRKEFPFKWKTKGDKLIRVYPEYPDEKQELQITELTLTHMTLLESFPATETYIHPGTLSIRYRRVK